MKARVLISLFLIVSWQIDAQKDLLQLEEDFKNKLEFIREAKEDEAMIQRSDAFEAFIVKTLKENTELFNHEFNSLRTMSTMKSPDDEFRFFNWNIELSDYTHRYFCVVMKKKRRAGEYRVTALNDHRLLLPPRTEKKLDQDEWRGSLYYDIIPVDKGNRTYYTLLAWDGNHRSSTIKILDVMYFQGRNIKFGYPLFDTPDGLKKRIYMEHKEGVIISVKYHPKKNQIIFDHLSPETEALEGVYEFYVPDMSYDAFEWKNGRWHYKADVLPLNDATAEDTKWKDPTDEDTPIDNGKHVKVPVEEEPKWWQFGKKSKEKKSEKKTPRYGYLFKTKKRGKKPRSAIGND